ncbi:hypothetical protein [Streptomyces sp. ME18-1-4]|uniref:hypothetical protein n=1 Tax=Streptomyces sp. ME18-1-4 TaxID=3028685 RepID=UPI0029AB71B2|nr:hypothetical protein [Streptomyces sp. ME18-1-4]MDX3242731.1 hypothetical protein [Streptomyces sp. ME18-1-4]
MRNREANRSTSAYSLIVVSALSRQAAELAREAGHRLSDTAQRDLEATLRAVVADQAAADRWAGGRLESTLTPPADFPAGDAEAAGPARVPARAAVAAPSARSRARDELTERRRLRQEQLAQARRAAEAADQRLREVHAEQADAEAALQQARARLDQVARQESAAEQRLRRARQELRRADQERSEAEERLRASADAVSRAGQAARDAAREVSRLSGAHGQASR